MLIGSINKERKKGIYMQVNPELTRQERYI